MHGRRSRLKGVATAQKKHKPRETLRVRVSFLLPAAVEMWGTIPAFPRQEKPPVQGNTQAWTRSVGFAGHGGGPAGIAGRVHFFVRKGRTGCSRQPNRSAGYLSATFRKRTGRKAAPRPGPFRWRLRRMDGTRWWRDRSSCSGFGRKAAAMWRRSSAPGFRWKNGSPLSWTGWRRGGSIIWTRRSSTAASSVRTA